MRARLVALIALLVCAALLTGCKSVTWFVNTLGSMGDMAGAGIDSLSHRKAADEPYLIDVVGPVAVDVELFNGNLFIDVNPELTEGVVTVTRRAIHGYGRKAEADASLDNINYTIEIVPGELGQVVQIRATTTDPEPHYQRIDMTIELPEVDGLRARTSNGDVIARNIQGAVDILTYDGEVRVMTDRPMRRPVTIINNCGAINYRVRGESTGRFDCQCVRGKVIHHVEFGEMIIHPGTDHDTLLASFNEGVNPITLRAADGDIRIAVVEEPTHVGTFIFFD